MGQGLAALTVVALLRAALGGREAGAADAAAIDPVREP